LITVLSTQRLGNGWVIQRWLFNDLTTYFALLDFFCSDSIILEIYM
jgi:hypothetical protein